MGVKRNAYRILVGKLEGKRPLGRPRRRWVDNIKMNLREIGRGDMNWIDLNQDGRVSTTTDKSSSGASISVPAK
jgi:hypothetical protein